MLLFEISVLIFISFGIKKMLNVKKRQKIIYNKGNMCVPFFSKKNPQNTTARLKVIEPLNRNFP